MKMPQPKLTDEILTAALEGYEAQKRRIDAQIAEIRSMLGGGPTGAAKRKVSASSRRKMARAQKLRWKKMKQGSEVSQAEKPKRHMSVRAQKKRRAAVKKASERPAATKKAPRKKAAPPPSAEAGA
jgi:hypothetical protein